jgi:hypothetical protein
MGIPTCFPGSDLATCCGNAQSWPWLRPAAEPCYACRRSAAQTGPSSLYSCPHPMASRWPFPLCCSILMRRERGSRTSKAQEGRPNRADDQERLYEVAEEIKQPVPTLQTCTSESGTRGPALAAPEEPDHRQLLIVRYSECRYRHPEGALLRKAASSGMYPPDAQRSCEGTNQSAAKGVGDQDHA